MTSLTTIFVNNVARLLKEKNITQVQLAEKLGIKASGVAKLLSKDTNPTLDRIDEVAKALKVPIIELLRAEGPYLKPHTLADCIETVKKALNELEEKTRQK